MPVEILRQQNWNNGELDPHMLGRRDLKAYYNSAALIENVALMPQGAKRRRPGQPFVDYLRHEIEAVALDAATLTAPNGGTAANAAVEDGTRLVTTGGMGTDDPYVILEIDFGEAVEVHLVDVIDAGAQADGGESPLPPGIEYPWNNGWLASIP